MLPTQLNDLKIRNPVPVIAGQWVTLRKGGMGFKGPCPICSQNTESNAANRFECTADRWVCAVCADGGDVIALVRKREGISFDEACARLGGAQRDAETPASAKRRGEEDYRRTLRSGLDPPPLPEPKVAEDDRHREQYLAGWRNADEVEQAGKRKRETERRHLYSHYQDADNLHRSAVADYLAIRCCTVPQHTKLRGHPDFPMYAIGPKGSTLLVHRGPAMLAPIQNAKKTFSGLHITWLDLAATKGKAIVTDPGTGEIVPARKVRGTKAGGYIDLGYAGDTPGPRMFCGEGIETVLSAYTLLQRTGRLRPGDRFRCAIDLGNLAGKAAEHVQHPTWKAEKGRSRRIGGPVPDLMAPAMPVPDEISELVIIADGDSDPFLTSNAMARAKARHSRPGRTIRVVWPK